MTKVLVAIPYRSGTPRLFLDMACKTFASLTFPQRELAMWPNAITDERPYGSHAQARNQMIEMSMNRKHTHVLWLDVDLVRVPADLIERLLEVSNLAAVAPFVYVERLDPARNPSRTNGGWFYDIGGFVRNGEPAQMYHPLWADYKGGTIEMDSIGCCYLAPADVYRDGCRYQPVRDEVEHVSFFAQARARHWRVLATDAVTVEHAFLPKYGEKWSHQTRG
jgi:Anp1